MKNCNNQLVELLNAMDEYIIFGEEKLKKSILNEEFKEGMNTYIEGFIMAEKVIQTHSEKLNEITLKEKNKLAEGLELSIQKINSKQEYSLDEYINNIVKPFKIWKNLILNNIVLAS
jgi:hypothetical protein